MDSQNVGFFQVRDAYENARFLCDSYYLTSPSMELECLNALCPDKKISIVAVPSHLYHIMFELFKNAMRATVEFIGVDEDLPPLIVRVVRGHEDLSIKVFLTILKCIYPFPQSDQRQRGRRFTEHFEQTFRIHVQHGATTTPGWKPSAFGSI